MTNQIPLTNILDPSAAADQIQLDRRMRMADILRQQSLQQDQNQVAGGYVIPTSPFASLNKIMSGYLAGNMDQSTDQMRKDMATRQSQMLMNALKKQQPPETSTATGTDFNGAPLYTTDQPKTSTQSDQFDLGNLIRGKAISEVGGDQAGGAFWKQYDPTDATKMAMAAGVDTKQANLGALNKANYIAPISMRKGAALVDPTTNQIINFSPDMPANSLPIIDNGRITGVTPLPGASQITQSNAYSSAAGAKGYPAVQVPSVPQSPSMPSTGIPSAGVPSAMPNQPRASAMPPGVPSTFGPTSDAAIAAYGSGQKDMQTNLDKKWTTLQEQNQQAQTTNSYLQNIKGLAATAATGPGADKKEFVNGLLSLVGNEKATDATTANNLLDKYQGQIIARLGQGGMGTDAARSLLASAYPGQHMNVGAINEAVDNLVGANEMIKAKTNILSSSAAKRDPITYQANEIKFDQNADPRLWQYKAIAGTPQGKVFLQNVLKQDPSFLKKAQALHDIGAF